MRRKTVPIVSGNVKYLGLSVPEWTLALGPSGIYFIILSGKVLYISIAAHLFAIMLYVIFISKLEENILQILLLNLQIPDVVYGYFKRPIPIKTILTISSLNDGDDNV